MRKCAENLPAIRASTLPALSRSNPQRGALIVLRLVAWANSVAYYRMRPGDSLEEGLRKAFRRYGHQAEPTMRRCRVWVDGREYSRPDFARVQPRVDSRIGVIVPMRGGGGGKMSSVLSIAVMVAAVAATAYVGGLGIFSAANFSAFGPVVPGALAGFGGIAGAVAGAGVMLLGTMAVSMIAPMPSQKGVSGGNDLNFEQTQAISGSRNSAEPYGIVPWVLGTVRYAPRFAAPPYSEVIDGETYHYYLLLAGKGRVRARDGRVGDTPNSSFTDYSEVVHEGWTGDTPLSFFKNTIIETAVGVELLYRETITRSCPPGASRIGFQVLFQSGLMWISKKGEVQSSAARLYVEYRIAGGQWQPWSTPKSDSDHPSVYTHKPSGKYQRPHRRAYYKNLPAGDYEIRITNVWKNDNTTQRINDATFELLRGSFSTPPVGKGDPITLIEVRVKQGNQFQGSLDEFNWEFTSYAPVPSGSSWVDQPTNNPASLALLVARSGTDKPQPWSAIDQDQYREFYADCKTRGFEFNTVITSEKTAGEVTRDILSGGRASYFYRPPFGHSVLADRPDKPFDFDFSPLNSWGFEASKDFYIDPLQALRILFLNKEKEYAQDERIVYADGYNASNTTRIDEITMTGQTDPAKVYREARFHMAQAELRPETHTFYTDFAGLTVARGSRIRFAHDAIMIGLSQGRVVGFLVDYEGETPVETLPEEERNALPLLGLILDAYCPMESGKAYCARVFNGIESVYYSLVTEPNTGDVKREIRFARPLTVGTGPQQGEMVYFGEAERESMDGLVLDIERQEDLIHKITFCDFAPNVHTEGKIPAFVSNITAASPWSVGKPEKPVMNLITSGEEAFVSLGGSVEPGMLVTYRTQAAPPETALYVEFQYKLRNDGEWAAGPRGDLSGDTVRIGGIRSGEWYDIRARVVGTGRNSDWTVAAHYAMGLLTALPDVSGFTGAFTENSMVLTWLPVETSRAVEYEIRRGYTWENAVVAGIATETQIPISSNGTYFIKARSLPAYSENAAVATVTGYENFQQNIIAVLDEARDLWPGLAEGFDRAGSTLIFNPSSLANYDFRGVADVREMGNVRALSSNPYRTAVYTLHPEDVIALQEIEVCTVHVEYGAYILVPELDVRSMADIRAVPDMRQAIDGISTIQAEMRLFDGQDWGDWIPFTQGNYAALKYDFRLLAEAPDNGGTLVVTDFLITVDVPDRRDAYSFPLVPAEPRTLEFSRAFNGGNGPESTPVITATVENATQGETVRYWDVTRTGLNYCVMRGDTVVPGYTANIYAQGW